MNQVQWLMKTKIGPLYLIASDLGLQGVLWEKSPIPMAKSLTGPEPKVKWLSQAVSELEEYFKGARRSFNLPFDITGTPFQKSVWKQLSKIPYGKTCSYRDIARRIQNENAVRAVGSANGKNPISIIVPCHRVIAADGSLGGYSAGLAIKIKLLELEQKAGA